MLIHRFITASTDKPAITPFAKCLLYSYAYLCLNCIVCCISFALPPEGHYLQLLVTLRTFSVWGLINGVVLMLTLVSGPEAYKNFFKYVLMILTRLYDSANEFMVLFLIACFISYLNVPFFMAMAYGGLNVLLSNLSNSRLKEIFGGENLFTMIERDSV